MSAPARPRAAAVPLRHVEHCMGTVFSVDVAAPGVERHDLLLAVAWLHDVDLLFSTYRPDSEISRLDAGTLAVGDADPAVRHVLAECERYRELTGGWFDARADGRHLDPSGYVKGWAVQTVSDRLAAAGSRNHCVNGGGDVVCAGRPAPGRRWRVGVADPRGGDALLRTVTGDGPLAVATSGTAERGAHVLDPHRRVPATGLLSATVVAADLVTADVHATAAVAMGPQRARRWLAGQGLLGVLVTARGEVIDVGPLPGA